MASLPWEPPTSDHQQAPQQAADTRALGGRKRGRKGPVDHHHLSELQQMQGFEFLVLIKSSCYYKKSAGYLTTTPRQIYLQHYKS